VRPRRASDNQRDDANGGRANRQMGRHRECTQHVEGCHMTEVQSDFEGPSPTAIVVFIARSVYRLQSRPRVATLLTNHLRPTVSQNRSHPVVSTASLPSGGPSRSRPSCAARLLCTHGKSGWDVPGFEFTPASSKHCTSLAYPRLHYTAREGFLVNTRSPIIAADWVLLPRGSSTS